MIEIKFLNDPTLPPSLVLICGSERASPRERITHVMQTHQKGTVSLGEATHDPQFWNGFQEN
jgi:hypothetical protein